ncbi:MAG TPA: DUF1697 domain-containing protein [Vicinamibacteria bacterium]|nr:DUF1697 domain-containing protein [Vicinamibacteria bacterium]
MGVYIALLRGINVGGHKRVSMAELRALFGELGFDDVQSLLQSGNVVFRTDRADAPALERLLEKATKKHLGIETVFFVRTAAEWKTIVARNPFPEEAKKDPSHLLVLCLKQRPKAAAVKSLEAAIIGSEVLRVSGRQAYIVYPDGVGRSRLTNALIERKLGGSGTARNWSTVLKLAALASSS